MIRFLSVLAILAAAAVVVLLLPLEVPYTISTVGKVIPAREWLLVRSDNGAIGTLLRDNLRGTVASYDLHQFERGDAVQFELDPGVKSRTMLAEGDTVGRIYSNETRRRLAELSGRLAAAKSTLSLHASGEKPAILAQAQKQIERAEEQARQQRQEVQRLRQLYDRKLISASQIEAAQSLLQIFDADVAIAQAELDALRTGAKPEQLALARTEAESHRMEIAVLTERLDMFTIRSPISGMAVSSYGADTLLILRDMSSFLVVMPLVWNEYRLLEADQAVSVELPGLPDRVKGRVLSLGDTFHRLHGRQVLLVTALLESSSAEAMSGALASCSIETGRISLFEYFKRKMLS